MPSFETNLGLTSLPELDQKKYPEVYAELLRLRNAIRVLQSVVDLLAGTGSAAGTKLTKNSTSAFDASWI